MSSPSPSSRPLRRPAAGAGEPRSPFFSDLAAPVLPRVHTRSPATRVAGAGVSSSPPPPPVLSLDDRLDVSPSSPPALLFRSPSFSPSPRLPAADAAAASSSRSPPPRSPDPPVQSPSLSTSPVRGVVETPQQLLLTLTPNAPGQSSVPSRNGDPKADDSRSWVTVFGFHISDTNIVIREFEKCGSILKHIAGPRDSNWMHLLYQSSYDARKAIEKNGVQLHAGLIVGVKLVDPAQCNLLNEKMSKMGQGGFHKSFPPKLAATVNTSTTTSNQFQLVSTFPGHRVPNTDGIISSIRGTKPQSATTIAAPANSLFSKALDMVFGI